MPSHTIDWGRRAEPEELPEWMDGPCSYEDFRACLHDLGLLARVTLGYRPTLHFLDRIVAQHAPALPLRIVDVGSGGGDMLRRIAAWAAKRRIAVELAGIDLNPFAARAAQGSAGDHDPIRWLTGDAFSYDGNTDIVISSLLTHHLPSVDVVRFLQWMETRARLGWFVNDLERSARACSLYNVLMRLRPWHHFLRHDGPVSFRRSFVAADWVRLLAQAGIPEGAVRIESWRPARLCVSRCK